MSSDPSNENERMIARIDKAMPSIKRAQRDPDDLRVLTYVRKSLLPEAVAARGEEEGTSVKHLREVANTRLRPYESQEATN